MKRKYYHLCFSFLLGFYLCGYLLQIHSTSKSVISSSSEFTENVGEQILTLDDALKSRVGKDNIIFLSSVDSAYLPLAINVYETSFKKLSMDNYLFVCSDIKAHSVLQARGIASFPNNIHIEHTDKASNYKTKDFWIKTHLKTKIILDALRLRMTAIIVDLDIVLFKDPVPLFDCKDCDIVIQDDIYNLNSGFYMARPTKQAITLHEKAWESVFAFKKSPSIGNQKVLNKLIKEMQNEGKLKVKILSRDIFPVGLIYFEKNMRMFFKDNPPVQEALVHNNWIVSKAAKIYRFKELLLWWVDSNGYYTDTQRKYLKYENVLDLGSDTVAVETEALKAGMAIAYLLNRTLILPAFSCRNCKFDSCKVASKKCIFSTHFKIATFDSQFLDQYREHVFLDHPLVPAEIRRYSTTFLINSAHYNLANVDGVQTYTPDDMVSGATVDEILQWFGKTKEPVLKIHSLYGSFGGFQDQRLKELSFKLSKSIDTVNYRQQ